MNRLLLMRHAKTETWYEGIDDESRALVARGHTDATLIAGMLVKRAWVPDVVLISPARRARETWLVMEKYLEVSEKHIVDELYLIGTRGLAEIVHQHEYAGALMIIGHNPGIHDFSCQIASEAGTSSRPAALALSQKMPTGAVALFETDGERAFNPAVFRLEDFVRPKSLRSDK
ncbi:MAG: histidine phosphatase family protein [Pseudomonadota bacterium]